MWFNITWSLDFVLSQICVLFAVLSLALSCCTKNRVLILILSLLNSIFYGLEFLFLKEYAGAILNFIGTIRSVWFFINDKYKVSKKASILSLVICLFLISVGTVLAESGIFETKKFTFSYLKWYSIFPLIATLTYSIAVWQKDIKFYRWALIPVEMCGVAYNIMCNSLFGLIFESILLIIAIISVIKFYKKNDKHKIKSDLLNENELSKNSEKTPI